MTDEDEGGDRACWLGVLCPECGAMPSAGTDRCWRCGAPRPGERGERVDELRESDAT
ncbi:MAG: hypothetical protein ACRDQ0_19565 [Pseudonocardia sp.]